MSDIDQAKRLVANEDWKWAKSKLETIIEIYNTVGTLDYKLSDTALAKQVRIRKDVAAILRSFIDEIEGTATVPPEESEYNTAIRRF